MVAGKKKRSKLIRRRKDGSKSNMYFHAGTTAAIERYLISGDDVERRELYMREIFPAFDKLVENLIFIHGFRGLHDTYDDLKNDCVTFLYEAIHKFDPSRGSKPFSYFNVVAKNWLIIRSKQRVNKMKKSISIDDELLSRSDRDAIESHHVLPAQDEQMESIEFIIRIATLLDEIRARVVNENELRCIDAISDIFTAVSDVDGLAGDDLMLNKRSVFLLIREMSGLTPKALTLAIAALKRHYRALRTTDEFGLY